MDDPNITMEEYIKLEEEKARRHGRVFNWQTTTYGKIRIDDDLHDLSSVEAEFPAIVINDAFALQDALQCKSQVSTPFKDEIYFRISFDESNDEDYTIICDKNSFFYKMISVKNLKTDSENDNEKVIPSIPSPELAISCFDDLDFLKDFENEFLAIVYNDAWYRIFKKRAKTIAKRTKPSTRMKRAQRTEAEGELLSLFEFEEVMSIPHNNMGPPPAGPPPLPNNDPPPMVIPNGQAPRSMEELCQPSIDGRGGPIAPIPIQAMDFGLGHHMIQQV
ncbi:hypothetical protein Tco_0287592 [Tanacetum coccineum]